MALGFCLVLSNSVHFSEGLLSATSFVFELQCLGVGGQAVPWGQLRILPVFVDFPWSLGEGGQNWVPTLRVVHLDAPNSNFSAGR